MLKDSDLEKLDSEFEVKKAQLRLELSKQLFLESNELRRQENEERKQIIWKNPIALGLSAAILTALANLTISRLNSVDASRLQERQNNSDIFISILSADNSDQRLNRLEFAAEMNLINIDDTTLQGFRDDPSTLPSFSDTIQNSLEGFSSISREYPSVHMPNPSNNSSTRKDKANAHTLFEDGAPFRDSNRPPGDPSDLLRIVEWLNPENTGEHIRYAPRGRLSFPNIYASDVAYLMGVYLPRVWWRESALIAMDAGAEVAPLYGNTIKEMRANDLHRWLVSHGESFGWYAVGSVNELQEIANNGGLAIITGKRVNDGSPGHISIVMPETRNAKATRDEGGQVVFPVESQAGALNVNARTQGTLWWKDARFSKYGFWAHE